ncbi:MULTISPECIES: response regulator [unclassified Coleofasciculus]|uniref:hybrid sensor histidine kinase/response regulator n=1 Tax=unclassified Coleofasciculus TaxID=2692782 RepID=UPI00187E65E7|nr:MULTISPECIES: response regulator [unclassified Coleofasciculus]MBE9128130.1 response regulator [Coleofasciculus sp. LEGE 07081]MBE9151202.1 response regulator [Coleofasciculus sp. LEGE 07092]
MEILKDKDVILIVDDSPNNLDVLSETLANAGLEIAVALDGETAIEQIEYEPPTLILLDVMMPGIDGFETCRRLKANPSSQNIPIIFMTALTETDDKIKGLNLGAVDYIVKPFQQEEVLARVRVHLQLRSLAKTLEEKNARLLEEIEQRTAAEAALQKLTQELEQRVEERTAKLAQALQNWQQAQTVLIQNEKMYNLGQMIAGVAHEINNPVSSIHGNLTCADEYIKDLLQLLNLYAKHYPNPLSEVQNKANEIDIDFLVKDLPKLLNSMQLGTDRICQIISSLRDFSRIDPGQMMTVDLHQCLDSTLILLQYRLQQIGKYRGIQVIKEYGSLPPVECYPGLLNQVLMNILTNAVDALEELEFKNQASIGGNGIYSTKNPPTIWIRTEVHDSEQVAIYIRDNGSGIVEKVHCHLFEPFFTTKAFGKGTGLGLSISYEIIVEKHGGKLSCISAPGQGAEFIIEIPIR